MAITTNFKITLNTTVDQPTPIAGNVPPLLVFSPNQGSSQMFVNPTDVGVGYDLPNPGDHTVGRWDLMFRYNAPYYWLEDATAKADLAIIDPINAGIKVLPIDNPAIETKEQARSTAIAMGAQVFPRLLVVENIIVKGKGIRQGMECFFGSAKRGIVNRRVTIISNSISHKLGEIFNQLTLSNLPLLTAKESQRKFNRPKPVQRIATYLGA